MELFETGEIKEPKIVVDTSRTLAEARREGIDNIERSYLKSLLEETRGKIKMTAQKAGITTRHLHKLLTKYGIRKEEYKK
jgi:DNA-binding NtrC family response regulator